MTAASGQPHCRWRRPIAAVALWAFLLATSMAWVHRHGSPIRSPGPASGSHVPTVQSSGSGPPESPSGCLACLWDRTAVGGLLAGRPQIAVPFVLRLLPSTPRMARPQLLSTGHPSRAPPAPSA